MIQRLKGIRTRDDHQETGKPPLSTDKYHTATCILHTNLWYQYLALQHFCGCNHCYFRFIKSIMYTLLTIEEHEKKDERILFPGLAF